MKKLRRIFTRWYVKRGYTFGYDFTDVPVYSDGYLSTPGGIPKTIWNCPWWVKPLLIFFSPSVYMSKTYGEGLTKGFYESFNGPDEKGE